MRAAALYRHRRASLPLETLGAGLPAEGIPALRPAQNMNKEPFFGEK